MGIQFAFSLYLESHFLFLGIILKSCCPFTFRHGSLLLANAFVFMAIIIIAVAIIAIALFELQFLGYLSIQLHLTFILFALVLKITLFFHQIISIFFHFFKDQPIIFMLLLFTDLYIHFHNNKD